MMLNQISRVVKNVKHSDNALRHPFIYINEISMSLKLECADSARRKYRGKTRLLGTSGHSMSLNMLTIK